MLKAIYYAEAEFYDEYTVTTSAGRERREVSRQTISLQEARRIPGTNGDVVRVVQNLPGVARAPFGIGLLVIRGSSPGDSAVFLEGDEMPIVYHFLAGPAVVNSEMIESIDFFPGNFSPRYGRATAGIIDLKTRSPRDDDYHGYAKVDLQDTAVLAEGPITENLSVALSGRRSYVDVVLGAVLPDDLPTVAPYYYDYQGWLTYRGFDDHLLELFVYGSRDELRILFNEAQGGEDVQFTGIRQETEFNRGQVRWEWRPNEFVENKLLVSGGVANAGFSLEGGGFGISNDVWLTAVRNDLSLKLAEPVTLRIGADMQYAYSDFTIDVPNIGGNDEPEDDPNPFANGLDLLDNLFVAYPAFWTELELRPLDRLLIAPGLRLDHYANISRTTLSPRLTARYGITDEIYVKGGVGLFDQPPEPGNTVPGLGNPRLLSEKALHYALGGEWRPLEYLEFDVTLFYRDAFDSVVSSDEVEVDAQTGASTFEFFDNDGLARSYGAEILLRHYPNNRFFGWIAYTLSRSERVDTDTGEWVPFGFDQTHILTLVAGYNLPYNVDLSARFRYVTGNPYTPVVGSVFNSDEDDYDVVFGATNSARNGAFNQLDLRVDKRFVFDTWMFALYLDVQNVYNASNPEGVQRNYDATQERPFNGLPIFPNLGLIVRI